VSHQPERVAVTIEGEIAHLRLDRAAKRNALDDATIARLHRFFADPPAIRAAVLDGAGDHFCARQRARVFAAKAALVRRVFADAAMVPGHGGGGQI